MELRIQDTSGLVDTDFGCWLISRIKTRVIYNLSKYHLNRWDIYLNESKSIQKLYNKKYKTEEVILFAVDNIVCSGTSGDIIIHVDTNKFVPGFDRVRLITLLKTINYGTLDMKGCPIITDTLNYFAQKINHYVSLYYNIEV